MNEEIREKRTRTSQKVRFGDKIVEIATVVLNDVECLRFQDVQRRFPSVSVLCLDNIQLPFLCDKDGNDLIPLRIEACTDQILEGLQSIEQHSHENNNELCHRLQSISIDLEDVRKTNQLILANTQVTLLRLKHLMTQIYELKEFTTPRYFFILPSKSNPFSVINDIQNLFVLHYKLYFLCECSDDADKLHVAPHSGYSITKPKEFISKYGSYLRTTMTVARTLLTIGGFAIPQLGNVSTTLANTIVPAFDKINEANLTDKFDFVEKILDGSEQRLSFLDRTDSNQHEETQNRPVQGVELRELQNYLKSVDNENTLGNLYRIVTDDGHVRWVCFQHYNSIGFHRKMSEYIRQFESLGGTFNEQTNHGFINENDLSTKTIDLLCDQLTQGFNLSSLSFHQCSFNEKDLDKLFEIVINRSSIRCLTLSDLTIRPSQWLRLTKTKVEYICGSLSIHIYNHLLKIQFYQRFTQGDIKLLIKLTSQNKICRILHLLGVDFCQYGKDLRLCFQSNTELTTLIINYSNDIQFLTEILNGKCSIHHLKLSFWLSSSRSLTNFCEILSKNSTLVELTLMDHLCFDDQQFTIELVNVLRHHKSIKRVTLHVYQVHMCPNKENTLIETLFHHSFLYRLHLSQSIISTQLFDAIVYAFQTTKTLTRLECYDCQIDEKHIQTLQSIEIDDNFLFSKEPYWILMIEQMREQFRLDNVTYRNTRIEQLIRQEPSRSEIKLLREKLTDRDMEMLIEEALIGKQCIGLYLGSNSLTAIGISMLADALRFNQTLDRLWLYDNQIGDHGTYFLCQTFSIYNRHLTKLDLGKNGISDEGIQHICQMLQLNKTLTRLYLTQNEITDRGVHFLTQTIQQSNSTIQILHLSQNQLITDASIESILSMIEHNQSLEDLRITDCHLSQQGRQRLHLFDKQKNNFKIWT